MDGKTNPADGKKDLPDLLKNSSLYREFLAERDEILKHKWLESEKAGYDIGFEKALLDWIIRYRGTWRTGRSPAYSTPGPDSLANPPASYLS